MRLLTRLFQLGASLLAGSLAGCAVYVPMQAAAPDIHGRGQAEVAASWSLTNRFEAAATYSPLRHLLVRAAGSTKGAPPASDSAAFSQSNQYELGVGTYWPVGQRLVVGGLLGFGRAHSEARYEHSYPLFTAAQYRPAPFAFDAHYSKFSGEAYLTWQPVRGASLGLAYRLVQLRLTDVTDQGVPVTSAPLLRHEPMLYFRLRPRGQEGLVQVQLAYGLSTTAGFNDKTYNFNDPLTQFQVARPYVSVGLGLYPHLLWRR